MTAIFPSQGLASPSPATTTTGSPRKTDGVQTMAADFEAIFVRQMLTAMRSASLGEGLFDGQGMEQFRDLQDAKIAETIAQRGVFGISQLLTQHLENPDV